MRFGEERDFPGSICQVPCPRYLKTFVNKLRSSEASQKKVKGKQLHLGSCTAVWEGQTGQLGQDFHRLVYTAADDGCNPRRPHKTLIKEQLHGIGHYQSFNFTHISKRVRVTIRAGGGASQPEAGPRASVHTTPHHASNYRLHLLTLH